jgi:hypothetical protein
VAVFPDRVTVNFAEALSDTVVEGPLKDCDGVAARLSVLDSTSLSVVDSETFSVGLAIRVIVRVANRDLVSVAGSDNVEESDFDRCKSVMDNDVVTVDVLLDDRGF